MTQTGAATRTTPKLKPRLLSHGTVECHDLRRARRFYTELLGMEVVQTSKVSLMLRLNSTTIIACVETKGETSAGQYSHFGLDFETVDEVDEAHRVVLAEKDSYGVRKVTKPAHQHGTYAFYIIDADDNWWEFLTNPEGGYGYVFEMGDNDKAWRDQNQGRDRIGAWERRKESAE